MIVHYMVLIFLIFIIKEICFAAIATEHSSEAIYIANELELLKNSITNDIHKIRDRVRLLDYKNDRENLIARINELYFYKINKANRNKIDENDNANSNKSDEINSSFSFQNYHLVNAQLLHNFTDPVLYRGLDANPEKGVNIIAAFPNKKIEQFGINKNGQFVLGFSKEYDEIIIPNKKNSIKFSPDGDLISYTGNKMEEVLILNKATGGILIKIIAGKGIEASDWIASKVIALGDKHGTISVFQISVNKKIWSSTQLGSMKLGDSEIITIKSLPNFICFVSDNAGKLYKINLQTFEKIWEKEPESKNSENKLYAIDTFDDKLAIGGQSRVLHILNSTTSETITTVEFNEKIYHILFSPCGNILVVHTLNEVALLDMANHKVVSNLTKETFHDSNLNSVAISWKRKYVYVGTDTGHIYSIDLVKNSELNN